MLQAMGDVDNFLENNSRDNGDTHHD